MPNILVRVRARPNKVAPRPPRISANTKPKATNTYADDQFNESFEAALTNGNEALVAGDMNDAVGYFEQAGIMTLDDPRPAIGWGIALARQGKHLPAFEKFQQAQRVYEPRGSFYRLSLERRVDADQIYGGLGFAAMRAALFDESLKAYAKVVDLTGQSGAVIHNNMGIDYANLRMYPEAEEAFKLASGLDSKNPDVLMNLGILYVVLRDRDKAIAIQEKLSAIDAYRAGMLQREIENMR
ncbi:MAG: hypothetical protein ABIP75_15775 [Pyrinomonadaceae bacterium]